MVYMLRHLLSTGVKLEHADAKKCNVKKIGQQAFNLRDYLRQCVARFN